ncbi:aminopeptidase P family protein [Mesorhizobium sp. B2-4-6]|nr:aminopeptidase P family protein [Mesorhizobium sp. B2-4-6]
MQVMMEASHPGVTEGEIVGEGLRWLAASGGFAYDVAVSSGAYVHRYRHRQALPTWDSRRRIEEGDMIHFDLWGPVAHGYYCDLTRSTVVGAKPGSSQLAVIEDSINIVESIIAEVEPGRRLSELHAAGTKAVAKRGGGDSNVSAMIPFFGHSMGLDCDTPFITSYAEEIISPGMVFAIECFLTGKSGEGAGFEHVIHVGDNSVEVLTAQAPARPWMVN